MYIHNLHNVDITQNHVSEALAADAFRTEVAPGPAHAAEARVGLRVLRVFRLRDFRMLWFREFYGVRV